MRRRFLLAYRVLANEGAPRQSLGGEERPGAWAFFRRGLRDNVKESMAFRFRRSLRLLPGLRLNIGRRSASISVGRPGATVNLSNRGVYGTVGIPGTGLSVRERLQGPASPPRGATRSWIIGVGVVVAAIMWALLKAL